MTMDPQEFLMGGGGTSARFENIGDRVTGTITVTPEIKQQTDPQTGKPSFWDNGDPKMQLIVTLATDQRDDTVEDDDGTRRLFVKGKMQYAIRDAVKTAGAKGLEVGGRLTVTHTGLGDAPFKGASRAKLYAADYVSAANVALAAPEPTQAPQPATPAPLQQVPAQLATTVPAADPGQPTAEQLAAFAAYMATQQQQKAG